MLSCIMEDAVLKSTKKARSLMNMASLVLALIILPGALAEEAGSCFFRVDMDSTSAWKEPLSNVRFLTKDAWKLKPMDQASLGKYGLTGGVQPCTDGLDTLNISGSAEFSEDQFRQLARDLRRLAGDREVWIVDCRLESHALLNGIAVSWYGDHNWANKGMTLSEAEADEAQRFGSLPGTVITAWTAADNAPGDAMDIAVDRWMTEQELVEGEGFRYLRLAANDHSWPEESAVEAFISFVEELDRTAGLDRVWLHFHCHAGKSRTGIFMAIYDMMKNPGVSFEDIVLRQAMTGSSYFPYVNAGSELAEVYAMRAKRIRQVYDYLHENWDSSPRIPWTDWIAGR